MKITNKFMISNMLRRSEWDEKLLKDMLTIAYEVGYEDGFKKELKDTEAGYIRVIELVRNVTSEAEAK